MKSLYFECNAGISGDMAVASLLDLGADQTLLEEVLSSISANGFSVKISRVKKNGIDACDFDVVLDSEHENHDHDMEYLFGHEHHHHHEHGEHEHHHHEHADSEHEHHHEHDEHHHEHRGLSEVLQIIEQTKMSDNAKSLATKIFNIIAQAESKAHGIPLEKVHFHEVGAIDSIVDVIAFAVCFENLREKYQIQKVYVPVLNEGTGTVRCQHGILPIPVPAVANIISQNNLRLSIMNAKGEFITPTGAAFVAAIKTDFDLPKTFSVQKIGLGAGKRNYEIPSILRAFLIEENPDLNAHFDETQTGNITTDKIIKLETNIDDSTGEQLGFLMDKLFEANALEANYIPCFMKKNRPGILLTVLCKKENQKALEKIIFKNSSTVGIRHTEMNRTILPREIREVQTEWGKARVKIVDIDGEKKCYPEYEDVKKIASQNNLPYDYVYRKILETS